MRCPDILGSVKLDYPFTTPSNTSKKIPIFLKTRKSFKEIFRSMSHNYLMLHAYYIAQ